MKFTIFLRILVVLTYFFSSKLLAGSLHQPYSVQISPFPENMNRTLKKASIKNELFNRLEVVGKQYEIEKSVAKSGKGVAVFVVPTLLTPLFISQEAVIFDGLFKLKKGFETAIPEGLIPEEKANNPKQLSTVLGRVLSVVAMLKSGTNVVVMYVEPERKKSDKKTGFVDKKQVFELQRTFRKHLLLLPISNSDYEQYKNNVCVATYCYNYKNSTTIIGIDGGQINKFDPSQQWGVRQGKEIQLKVKKLNNLLNKYHLPDIRILKDTIMSKEALFKESKALTENHGKVLF